MTPIHDHEINHKRLRTFDDYLQIALLLPVLGFLPAIITWKCIEVALAGQWDPALLPGLAAAWVIPGWLVGWMWVAGRSNY